MLGSSRDISPPAASVSRRAHSSARRCGSIVRMMPLSTRDPSRGSMKRAIRVHSADGGWFSGDCLPSGLRPRQISAARTGFHAQEAMRCRRPSVSEPKPASGGRTCWIRCRARSKARVAVGSGAHDRRLRDWRDRDVRVDGQRRTSTARLRSSTISKYRSRASPA